VPASVAENPFYRRASATSPDYTACIQRTFWGGANSAAGWRHDLPANPTTVGFWGVIVRGEYYDPGARGGNDIVINNTYDRISFAQITDGSSNTLVLGEKW